MYLTENTNFITKLKEFLKQTDENPEPTFNFMIKEMYIQDLMNYTRAHSGGKVVSTGYGNYAANIVLLLDSTTDGNEVSFFRSVIPNLEIKIQDIYITPYNKVDKADIKMLKNIEELELKCISPKCILSVGDHGLKIDGATIILIDKVKLHRMFELMAKKDKITDEEKTELNKVKQEIWNKTKEIKKYC